MAEVYKTHRLIIASTVFILIILIGILTLRAPDYEYKLNMDQTIKGISLADNVITSEEAISKNSPFLKIDIRSHNDFLTDHIEGATNIPVSEILKKDNFTFLKEADQKNITIVIIGKDLLQANATWLILKQLGIKNLRFLPVGFDELMSMEKDGFQITSDIEEMNSEILSDIQVNASLNVDELSIESAQTKVKPVKKVKKTVTAGGC